ncbi:hypothetical protein DL96DRAFT_1705296 [Flagelloscypha sp. PMI_526]|nr:hypothetical protein DL96DRAFT_1705296 [Flagelloscypha sp. PMI_526]
MHLPLNIHHLFRCSTSPRISAFALKPRTSVHLNQCRYVYYRSPQTAKTFRAFLVHQNPNILNRRLLPKPNLPPLRRRPPEWRLKRFIRLNKEPPPEIPGFYALNLPLRATETDVRTLFTEGVGCRIDNVCSVYGPRNQVTGSFYIQISDTSEIRRIFQSHSLEPVAFYGNPIELFRPPQSRELSEEVLFKQETTQPSEIRAIRTSVKSYGQIMQFLTAAKKGFVVRRLPKVGKRITKARLKKRRYRRFIQTPGIIRRQFWQRYRGLALEHGTWTAWKLRFKKERRWQRIRTILAPREKPRHVILAREKRRREKEEMRRLEEERVWTPHVQQRKTRKRMVWAMENGDSRSHSPLALNSWQRLSSHSYSSIFRISTTTASSDTMLVWEYNRGSIMVHHGCSCGSIR